MADYPEGTLATLTVRKTGIRYVAFLKYLPGHGGTAWTTIPNTLSYPPSRVTDVRPMLALDPRDAEAVEKLTRALKDTAPKDANRWPYEWVEEAAMRFAGGAARKPDEPSGHQPRVRDEGAEWVRLDMVGSHQKWFKVGADMLKADSWRAWEDFPDWVEAVPADEEEAK
jgi:hypothetical protein